MILIPQLTENLLSLRAYSYQDRELDIVKLFLTQREFSFTSESIGRDNYDRKGILFQIVGILQIQRFERLLNIRFKQGPVKTSISFEEEGGIPYRCVRLKHLPWQNGCADIRASDDHAAFLKCSLLANEKNWFGADSERGTCKNK